MVDVKSTLTETLRAHLLTPFGRCLCGEGEDAWDIDDEAPWAAHLADVLLGLSGVAVTALPEPSDLNSINRDYERDVAGWDVNAGDGRIEVRVDIFRRITIEGTEYTAPEIRALVPALLAAAVVSEGETHPEAAK